MTRCCLGRAPRLTTTAGPDQTQAPLNPYAVAFHGRLLPPSCSPTYPIYAIQTPPYNLFDAESRANAIVTMTKIQSCNAPLKTIYIVMSVGADIVDELLFLHHIYGFTRRDHIRFVVDEFGEHVVADLQQQFEAVFPGAALSEQWVLPNNVASLQRDLLEAHTRPDIVPNFYQFTYALNDSVPQAVSILRLVRAFLHSKMQIVSDLNPEAMSELFGMNCLDLRNICELSQTDPEQAQIQFLTHLFGRYSPLQISALLMAFCEVIRDNFYDHSRLLDDILCVLPAHPPWLRSYMFSLVESGRVQCAARIARYITDPDDIAAALIRVDGRFEFCQFLHEFLGPGPTSFKVSDFRLFMEKCGVVSESRFPGEQLHHEALQLTYAEISQPDRSSVLQHHRQSLQSGATAGAVSVDHVYDRLCVFFATSSATTASDLRFVLHELLDDAEIRAGLWKRFTRPSDFMRRDPHGLVLQICHVSVDDAIALLDRIADHDDLRHYSPESSRYYPLLSILPEHDPRVVAAVERVAKRPNSDGLVSAFKQFVIGADRIRADLL